MKAEQVNDELEQAWLKMRELPLVDPRRNVNILENLDYAHQQVKHNHGLPKDCVTSVQSPLLKERTKQLPVLLRVAGQLPLRDHNHKNHQIP